MTIVYVVSADAFALLYCVSLVDSFDVVYLIFIIHASNSSMI